MYFLAVAFLVIACVILYYGISITVAKLGRPRHHVKHAAQFPGPPALPLIGNMLMALGTTEDFLHSVRELSETYPSPYRVWMANYLIFVIDNPNQIKVVLNSQKTIGKGYLYTFGQPWLGDGLLIAPEAKWRKRRRIIQPTFGSTIVKSYFEVFSAQAKLIAKEIERHSNGPEIEIHKYTSRYTLHSICITTMGVDLATKDNSAHAYYGTAVDEITAAICTRILRLWLHPDFIFNRTQLGKKQEKLIKFLHTFTDTVIRTKKEEHFERNQQSCPVDDEKKISDDVIPQKKVLLDHLLELSDEREKFSDVELRDDVDAIISGGSDPVTVTSSYTLLMLASYPEIQDKVYQELCEIYGDDVCEEEDLTMENLARMTYLECVIKETMRLFPVAPYIVREVSSDLDIDGKRVLPAGSTILINFMSLHRNEEYWPDPLTFDPDRFLPEAVEKRHQYVYLPFSGGLRGCIGTKYAMIAMKTLLATIIRRYVVTKDNILPATDYRLKWEFILKPVDPITLKFEKRTQNIDAQKFSG